VAGHKKQKITTCGGRYVFDKEAADRAVGFFEKYLVHVKGQWAGKPIMLEAWQQEEIIRPLFGWKHAAGERKGARRFRRLWLELPKKNGKSALASGLGLLLTVFDRESGAEVYSAATDKDQAKIVYGDAVKMLEASKKLRKYATPGKKVISVARTNSFFQAVSSEVASKHGYNSHGVLVDEVHAHRTPDLIDVLVNGAMLARRQPMVALITTAGWDQTSICWEYHKEALAVLEDEKLDEEQLVCIYAAEPTDDWTSPATWRKANPNLGVTITEAGLRKECERAQRKPRLQNQFKQLHLNIWTQQATVWLPMNKWDAHPGEVNLEELRGARCWGGLDLSSTTDLSAFVLIFKLQEAFKIVPWFFIPRENIRERETKDAVAYETWVKQGLIRATEGNVIDYNVIQAVIEDAAQQYDLQQVGFDPYNATQIVTNLGLKLDKPQRQVMVPVRQGMLSMSPPTKEMERLVLLGKLHHGGNPVLRWMANNAAVEQDSTGNIKPVKKSSTARIDGVVATVMALSRAQLDKTQVSVYNSRGLRAI
jgi:phage terminase large subunit-like protein